MRKTRTNVTTKAIGDAWENEVADLFRNIGYEQIDFVPQRYSRLRPKSFWLERVNPRSQYDIVVNVDQDHWLLIECRSRNERTFGRWFLEIRGKKIDALEQIRNSTRHRGLELHAIAASRRAFVTEKNISTARRSEVRLLHKGAIQYLNAIARGAKNHAEKLVLARFGVALDSRPQDIKVRAWGVGRKQTALFTGIINPSELGHLVYVNQRGLMTDRAAYQRFLNPTRIAEAARYLEAGNSFPNAIVCALPESARIRGSSDHPVIHLQGELESMAIIDGQHRFFGAIASARQSQLLCTFVRLPPISQAVLFASLNGKQVRVKKAELVGLFDIPGFAAEIARGATAKQREDLERQQYCYLALGNLNAGGGPLHNKLRLGDGETADNELPFKTIFDSLYSISKRPTLGWHGMGGDAQFKAKAIAKEIGAYLACWKAAIGAKAFEDSSKWFQATTLAGLILAYPDVKHYAEGQTTIQSLFRRRAVALARWKLRASAYRGMGGAKLLARRSCGKLKIGKPRFVTSK